MLEIRKIYFAYNKSIPVLKDVSFKIKPGAVTSLLGPSGCGKSTLLNIISGLLTPDKGHIQLAGKDITTLDPQKRKIGLMFQDYALFPHLTVKENILFPLDKRLNSNGKLLNIWLTRMQIENLSNSYPKNLSGGEKQRVALARSFINKPHCLLLDEPFAALDAHIRGEVISSTKEILKEMEISALMVTHDIRDSYHFADEIVILNHQGKIDQIGTISEVYENPASVLSGKLLGQINCLPARKINSKSLEVLKIKINEYVDKSDGAQESIVCFRPEKTILHKLIPEKECLTGKVLSIVQINQVNHFQIKVGDFIVESISSENLNVGDNVYITMINPIFFPKQKFD